MGMNRLAGRFPSVCAFRVHAIQIVVFVCRAYSVAQIAFGPQHDSVEGLPDFRVILHSGDLVLPACHEGTNRSQVGATPVPRRRA